MSIDNTQTFCQNVRRFRKRADLSLPELAQYSGLPLEMLERLEEGVIPKEMMVADALTLAKVFGCKTEDLFR